MKTTDHPLDAVPEPTGSAAPSISVWRDRFRLSGLVAGPVGALLCYFWLPDTFQTVANQGVGEGVVLGHAGKATLAVMIWMAIWWLTEAIDLFATALLPLVLFPILQIAPIKAAAAPYAHPLIFLFMGGFLMALSMQRWQLDRRIALLTLRLVGTRPANMVAGFMLVTALLSAFVSNTATTAMMLPIAISVISLTSHRGASLRSGLSHPAGENFSTCLMLGIAYAASVGGMMTIIGSPPNVFLVGYVRESIAPPYRTEISFLTWMMIGVPIAVVFLPIVWLMLTRLLFPIRLREIEGGKEMITNELQKLGAPNRGQLVSLLVFAGTALLWIFRPYLAKMGASESGVSPLAGLSDGGIAMLGALVLFVIPVSRKPLDFVMNWETAKELPWGILVLFGGGLSLASAVEANGVAQFLGSQASLIAGAPPLALVVAVCLGIVFLTELTSNTATTATLVPVLAAMAPGLKIHPFLLIFPATIAASCAFMLPVATPPNAIVFATGKVTLSQMMRAGRWLNVISVILITLLTFYVIAPVMGIEIAR